MATGGMEVISLLVFTGLWATWRTEGLATSSPLPSSSASPGLWSTITLSEERVLLQETHEISTPSEITEGRLKEDPRTSPSEVSTPRVIERKKTKKRFESLPIPLALKDPRGFRRDDGTYILQDTAGTPCVMAYFKATLTLYYPTDRNKEKYTSTVISPPDDVEVSGTCDRDSLVATLDLEWEQGIFSLRFAFDDLTDSWFVDQFKFVFNTSSSAFPRSDKVEKISLKSPERKRYWQTSHARSFRCLLLHDVSLLDEDDVYSGTIHFDEARVQALTKTQNFKTPKHCIHRVHRDEMVPVTVGGTLAGLTVLTVAGYGIFRYFKIKKFQYGTME